MSPLLDNETNIKMIKDYGYYFIPSLCSLLDSVMDVINNNDNVVLIIIIILCSLLHCVVMERFKNIDNDNDGVLIIIIILRSLLSSVMMEGGSETTNSALKNHSLEQTPDLDFFIILFC